MTRIAYMSPFRNPENRYIELQKAILEDLGFEVRPLSLWSLGTGRCWGLLGQDNLVSIHWLENRIFKVGKAQRALSPVGVASFAFYAAILALCRARVVYFVHDQAVHDLEGGAHRFSASAIRLLRRIADKRIVHDPSFADAYDAEYLPHPLYDEDATPPTTGREREAPVFVALGAIRPYKALHGILEHWPRGARLKICGKGDPAYVARLRAIVRQRGLQGVTIDARFLSDRQFRAELLDSDVLILPHKAGANLVSGAFFEGIGLTGVLLARRTPFIDWARQELDGVEVFESDEDLARQVTRLEAQWSSVPRSSRGQAVDAFGRDACRRSYQKVLGVTHVNALSDRPGPTVEGESVASGGPGLQMKPREDE